MTELLPTKLTGQELKTIAADVLQEALSQGAISAEVELGTSKGFTVTVRQGDVESIEYHQDKTLGVTVYIGKRSGSASLSDVRPEAVRDAVRAAYHIARFTDEDPCAGIAEKELLAFDYPDLKLAWPWPVTVEQAIEMGKAGEAAGLAFDKRVTHSDGIVVTTSDSWNVYANTAGFVGVFPLTYHEISGALIASSQNEMQQGSSYTAACDPGDLNSAAAVAKEAARRAVDRLHARRLTTRRVSVIFEAEEACRLLGHFVAAIAGGNLYRKASFLSDHRGKTIFPLHISLYERPHLLKGPGTVPFDDDGVMTRDNYFIRNGILENYCLGVYSGRKLGMQTTGNADGVHNLAITAGQKDLPALLKTMGTGLLVTELMGQGVNLVTGDYSRGAAGFWVENGEIQFPVHEITIAGNLRDMYAHLVEVGNDVDRRGNIQTGSILLDNMMIAGN